MDWWMITVIVMIPTLALLSIMIHGVVESRRKNRSE